ncbi:MAG: NAD-dependent epimerase/dehydratase family protein [Sphingobacteriales bacterium]|nr:MAG: NAD-dependent epimerase/dehydratase family protein [Sphingobacteriales bacterium]
MVLVTGASGFVGGELVHQLVANGEQVRIIVRKNSNINYLKNIISKIDVVEADILDIMSLEEAFVGVEKIYHSAAIIAYNKKQYDAMYKTNIEGTSNVVNAALSCGVKKILYISSIAAFAAKPNTIVDEETKWEENEWNTAYGVTKQMAERQIFRGIEEGLEATIINPGIIIGVGHDEQKSIMQLFKRIAKGKMPFYVPGRNGMIDVKDVVNISILLMNGAYNKERFIAINENIYFKDYFQMIAKAVNKPAPKYKLPKIIATIGYTMDAILSFINPNRKRAYTKENAKVAMQDFFYNNQKLKQTLNYQFIPFENTIQEIVKKLPHEK